MAGTTSKGIRFPSGTDTANVAQYFQNLANDVNDLLITDVATMASRPTTNRYVGRIIRPLNKPTLLYMWDGTRWVMSGVNTSYVSGAPAGSYVSRYDESVVTPIIDTNGRFHAALPTPFSAPPLLVTSFIPGNYGTEQLKTVEQLSDEHTGAYLSGFGQTGAGNVPSGTSIRVNLTVIGYNT